MVLFFNKIYKIKYNQFHYYQSMLDFIPNS
jgi:hypothetical protein